MTHHPADQARVDRLARAFARDPWPTCDHDRQTRECRACIELAHAEIGSVTVRAAYAFGDWAP